MDLSINTPALLFPAITLLLLAYTNRFLALANLIRKLHDEYMGGQKNHRVLHQIYSVRRRIHYIRSMQALAVFSFLCCVACMFCIYRTWAVAAELIFAGSLLSLLLSLVISLLEIFLSTKALELELSDMEELERTGFFSSFLPRGTEQKGP